MYQAIAISDLIGFYAGYVTQLSSLTTISTLSYSNKMGFIMSYDLTNTALTYTYTWSATTTTTASYTFSVVTPKTPDDPW